MATFSEETLSITAPWGQEWEGILASFSSDSCPYGAVIDNLSSVMQSAQETILTIAFSTYCFIVSSSDQWFGTVSLSYVPSCVDSLGGGGRGRSRKSPCKKAARREPYEIGRNVALLWCFVQWHVATRLREVRSQLKMGCSGISLVSACAWMSARNSHILAAGIHHSVSSWLFPGLFFSCGEWLTALVGLFANQFSPFWSVVVVFPTCGGWLMGVIGIVDAMLRSFIRCSQIPMHNDIDLQFCFPGKPLPTFVRYISKAPCKWDL